MWTIFKLYYTYKTRTCIRRCSYVPDSLRVYCDERYRDQTERTSRSKWAVTFDEQSNPLIECSFTISDVVSDKGVKSFWNVMRRARIISVSYYGGGEGQVQSTLNSPRFIMLNRSRWTLSLTHLINIKIRMEVLELAPIFTKCDTLHSIAYNYSHSFSWLRFFVPDYRQ